MDLRIWRIISKRRSLRCTILDASSGYDVDGSRYVGDVVIVVGGSDERSEDDEQGPE